MTPAHDSPLVDWFARRVELGPERIALCDPWGPSSPPPRPPVTYRELQAAARRTARFLAGACGVGRGDRVAVLARNSHAFAACTRSQWSVRQTPLASCGNKVPAK